uniref:Secreted protein n=1 Tax=Strombidium inclinatum TaxID=197538 RepID=A0A7S3MZ51_9SPIT|mmetsp:Transcript_24167/g.37136  ORF Transcript_24167/g.37136 Transcript_24167/m.37136 type:complete len:123 (+) Transcript_24167:2373-2741(+)
MLRLTSLLLTRFLLARSRAAIAEALLNTIGAACRCRSLLLKNLRLGRSTLVLWLLLRLNPSSYFSDSKSSLSVNDAIILVEVNDLGYSFQVSFVDIMLLLLVLHGFRVVHDLTTGRRDLRPA